MRKNYASLLGELEHQLRSSIDGEVRFDKATRVLYSTDASIYQIEPIGVVFPSTIAELAVCVEIASKLNVPILPRGSGSSLAGQAIGPALILDCSKHLQHILNINPEEKTATVEPGVILSSLNKVASRHKLQFGPDPASAERATIGGTLANNATGAHSIWYGMSADHFISAEVILSDGSQANFGTVTNAEAHQKAKLENLEGAIYRASLAIREEYSEEIKERWPKTWRRASGYNLNYLLPWSSSEPPHWGLDCRYRGDPPDYPPIPHGMLNLAPLLAGSEGTLAIISQATVRLVPLQDHSVLVLLAFPDEIVACEQVPDLLNLYPSAVELIPSNLIDLARRVPAYARQLSFIDQLSLMAGSVPTMLVVEFTGDDRSETKKRANDLIKSVKYPSLLAEDLGTQKQIWSVRKVGLGILMSGPGDIKPVSFIEDLSVPIENLVPFLREMAKILAEHGTSGDFYAHASAGCLHMRPLLNLKSTNFSIALREIAGEAVDLVFRLGGSASGEHGDGIARSEWLEKMYGKRILMAFQELKQSADPKGVLNPGKIVDALPMNTNLRYPPGYRTESWDPVMSFHRQDGLAGAVELCNGAGVCRKENGVMCPSFQATREEMHSTRGRANLLRELFSGRLSLDSELSLETVYEALDLCLACKGCKSECPSAVDMAKLKYEYLAYYYGSRGKRRALRDYLFAYLDLIASIGIKIQPLSNLVLSLIDSSRLPKIWLGLSADRRMPQLSKKPLHRQVDWLSDSRSLDRRIRKTPNKERVIFISDPFTEYFQPDTGLAAIHVLSAISSSVVLLPVVGTGRTLISKGFLREARAHASRVVSAIQKIDPSGEMDIVGVEPSEIYTLRDEYQDFFPENEQVTALAERTYMVDEFLIRPGVDQQERVMRIADLSKSTSSKSTRVLLHGHCYQKSQPPRVDGFPVGVKATQQLLERAGYFVDLIDSGCCGMAGAFGYESDHYDISLDIGELSLFPAVRKASPDVIVTAAGFSCLTQIEDVTGKKAIHPINLIHQILES